MANEPLSQAFKEVLAAIEEAQVPPELREVAFVRGLDHLLGGARPAQRGAAPPRPDSDAASPPGGDVSKPLVRIARRLHIDPAVASRVFDVDEEGVHVVVQRSKLSTSNKAAAQELTQLVAAARQAGGLDPEWTAVDEVRRVADKKGVVDTNFSKHVTALDGKGMRIRGPRGGREIKMNETGLEAAGQVAVRLAGEE
jgi:hypothetical protein